MTNDTTYISSLIDCLNNKLILAKVLRQLPFI